MASRSIFVKPSAIGPLDTQSHHVAYDAANTFLCSEPSQIKGLDSNAVVEELLSKLRKDLRPIKERLPELIATVNDALLRTQATDPQDSAPPQIAARSVSPEAPAPQQAEATPVPTRPARPLSTDEAQLRHLADLASRHLGLQLIIVQSVGEE